MNKIKEMREILELLKKDSLLDSTPVNLEEIADYYGIKIFYKYIDSLSGKIIKREDNDYEIIVSVLHPHTRQRFTLAHELAHYFLHRKEIGDGINENALYRSGLSNEIELEANRLASNIIMPTHKIHEYLEKIKNLKLDLIQNQDIVIPYLADTFEVSKKAMIYRLGLQNK